MKSGKIKTQEDLANDQTNWIDHGQVHAFDIALRGLEVVRSLRKMKMGYENLSDSEFDALQTAIVMINGTHDMG